ncbi:MAG: hypothetical protein ACYS9X_21920 [Planctomycetota bacterium]|jgi:hypothetical protein
MKIHLEQVIPFFGQLKVAGFMLRDVVGMCKKSKASPSMAMSRKRQLDSCTHQLKVRKAWRSFKGPTVCVWEPLMGSGHAALFIQPGGKWDETKNYVSWWPGDEGKADGARSFYHDCLHEGMGPDAKTTRRFRLPEYIKAVPSLKIPHLQAKWNGIRNNSDPIWKIVKNNCSTVAAKVMIAGMTKTTRVLQAINIIKAWWSPHDVKVLGDAIT